MNHQPKPQKLNLAFGNGEHFTATLLWEDAPRTCAAIVGVLPAEGKPRHAQWAGAEFMFSGFPIQERLPIENPFVWREPDFVITNKHPGGVLAFYPNPKVRAFCVLYGETIPRCTVDKPVAVTVFATIDEPQKAEKIGRSFREIGPSSLRISAVDDCDE